MDGGGHTEALRRIGVEVVGWSFVTRAGAGEGQPAVAAAVDSLDELLAIPDLTSVHITSPNDVHAAQARRARRRAARRVREPLGVDSAETAELVELAAQAGVVNAVCANAPLRAQPARCGGGRQRGARPRVSGEYLQDWLLLDTDWNWRLDAQRQGTLRAVADIAHTWLDLASSSAASARRGAADLHTFIEGGTGGREVETFASARMDDEGRASRSGWTVTMPPVCCALRRGARGSARSAGVGRAAHRLQWEIDGAQAAFAWSSDDPTTCGSATAAGERGAREGPALMSPLGVAATAFPVGTSRATRTRPRPAHRGYADVAGRRTVDAAQLSDVWGRSRRRRGVHATPPPAAAASGRR